MPNWCTVDFVIRGPEADIEKIKAATLYLNFQVIEGTREQSERHS